MSFTDTVKGVSGLTHYYPLVEDANDIQGSVNGTVTLAQFGANGAKFDGRSHIDLGDHQDFSVATTQALSIVAFLTITDWKGAGASEYIHWMGKGQANAHEWTFRHYVQDGIGEAPARQGRVSFYHFAPAGGEGAGAYAQDATDGTEHMYVSTCDMDTVSLWKDGLHRREEQLSGYGVVPTNTASEVRIGTRDRCTGWLIGTVRRVGFFNRVLTTADISKMWAARSQPDANESPDPP
jgi:hypothetical protein